ncbi:MAG TPA: THUMP domain-containing protein [Longimicrobiaceae bacterium]|nr:THUMP domain-containing protein [Longimicrobiaceae bacterium]
MTAGTLPLFAVAAPGLEALVAEELRALGAAPAVEVGGVAWEGTAEQLYAANLHLRTASRVLLRLAEFRARSFFELERHARRVPWERVVGAGRPVRIRVTSRKSKLYHEGAVEERLRAAIEHRLGVPVGAPGEAGGEEAEGAAEQLFVVRFLHDHCTVSADSSGALLHLRGYRQAVAKAPLRETLAAAMLLGSGWPGTVALLDPMCGSGTIPIEAALLARGIAPGLASPGLLPRAFAFQAWPDFDVGLWDRVVERARSLVLPAAPAPIHGSDRDAGAVEAARANAGRAGVLADLTLATRALSAVEPPDGPGWLVVNPPYGVRVGESAGLRNLYAALGRLARDRLPGWSLALLSADRRLEGQVGLPFHEVLRTRNGGIPVRLVVGGAG